MKQCLLKNQQVTRVKVSDRKDSAGDWVVRAYGMVDGEEVRFPNADYYTSDRQDAEQTAKMMVDGC